MGDCHPSRTVIVTGDVTIDWNLARLSMSRTPGQVWDPDDRVRACWQPGGAALLAGLISDAVTAPCADGGVNVELTTPPPPTAGCHPTDAQHYHSYALWEPHPYDTSLPRDKRRVWRVSEFLGWDEPGAGCGDVVPPRLPPDEPESPDLIVLDDAGLGFREASEAWPAAINRDGGWPGWIVVKMASPLARGRLWDRLLAHCSERLVVVMTVGSLRHSQVHVSHDLSWERTAQDLYWELTNNLLVNGLSRCRHVVVTLGLAGAFVLSRADAERAPGDPAWQCRLLLDPCVSERSWGAQHPGGVIGYTTCMAAAVARQLLLSPDAPSLQDAAAGGVTGMRKLQECGYGSQARRAPMTAPAFPFSDVAGAIAGPPDEALAWVEVEDPGRLLAAGTDPTAPPSPQALWTILDDVCRREAAGSAPDNDECLYRVAKKVVTDGLSTALRGVPIGTFNKLVTADRHEIEAYQAVRSLMAEYAGKSAERPLNIAVFGPPGAGKSFGVKQVAATVAPDTIEEITFNLSQFSTPSDLIQALHQVRDIGLSGKLPLVFWDEFDTTFQGPWGWLRYFLAPMQDGSFQEGQVTHPIGRAIFVFAGGVSHSMAAFDRAPDGNDYAEFRAAKGPDFVSRLKGYVDILGPNRCEQNCPGPDNHYIIRRAILLRGLLERTAPHLFSEGGGNGLLQIDPGVLRAFLRVRTYRHGVRSMEAIITMSMLAACYTYERSSLPGAPQLDVHVDGKEFLSWVLAPRLDGPLLERLAECVHEVFREEQSAKPEAERAPTARLSYAELEDKDKALNRAYVQDMRPKLGRVGYVMVPARSGETSVVLPDEHLETMTEMEHERWLRQKIDQGWRYAPVRCNETLENPNMVPWREMPPGELAERYGQGAAARMGPPPLSESAKRTTREMVDKIPRILAAAGYTVVRVRERAQDTNGEAPVESQEAEAPDHAAAETDKGDG